jgi:hypothetical protein
MSGGKMKTKLMIAMVLLLLAASGTLSQTPRATNTEANRSWASFWRQVTVAVNKKDRVALKKLMSDNFSDESGGLNGSEWLKFIDENARRGSWRDLQKSFAKGTKVNTNWPSKGIPTRVTKDNLYWFEYRKDKRWYFAGVVGD